MGDMGTGAGTVLDYGTLELIETQLAICLLKMPYLPTLLSFREIPPAVAAIKKLKLSLMFSSLTPMVWHILLGVDLQVTLVLFWVNLQSGSQKAGYSVKSPK